MFITVVNNWALVFQNNLYLLYSQENNLFPDDYAHILHIIMLISYMLSW